MNSTFLKQVQKKCVLYLIYFVIILAISITIRLFFIEIYVIPSNSMEDTILQGDIVLNSKITYGPRLPKSPFEIPWIDLVFYFNKKYRTKTDSVWWNYRRLKGFSKVNHNQVVMVNFPNNQQKVFIKRCMGLPGDTIQIINSQVYANNERIEDKGTLKFRYRILINNYANASLLLNSLQFNYYSFRNQDTNYFSTALNNYQKEALLRNKYIDSVIIEKNRPDKVHGTFPHNKNFDWTIDDFGPLIIPEKGMKITLNEENYALYRQAINKFENTTLSRIDRDFLIDGKVLTDYIFKNNYYFMLGDNRHESNDSRYWGLVPEQCIIGKAVLVLFSTGEEGSRWKRMFKIIH